MLRLFVLLLVLVNAAYFAWSQGMLRAYGWAPQEQSEPQRLDQQIRPDGIRILSIEEARRIEQATRTPPKPTECLQAGLFDADQVDALQKALESGWPAGTWVLEPVIEPGRWIIYMGKFSTAANLERRRSELERLKVPSDLVESKDLKPGLSLGSFDSRDRAQAALATLQKRGVRGTARVVQEKAEVRQGLLRVPAADEAARARLEELKPLLGDKAPRSCK